MTSKIMSFYDYCINNNMENLLQQWDYEKNNKLEITPHNISKSSKKKVYWKCDKGHSWQTVTSVRIRNSRSVGCPYCLNKKVDYTNCLLTIRPDIASEWNPTKNSTLTPKDVVYGSYKKVWWKCSKGHEWKALISSRTNQGTGCPYCANKAVCEDNCLATIRPDVAKEWHPIKNKNLTPYDFTWCSGKKVWWLCKECDNEWQSTIAHRVNDRGCPKCNSLNKSLPEQIIGYYLKQIFKDIISAYKIPNSRFEIDLFIPSLKLCIEYDGVQFHSKKSRIEKDEEKNKILSELGIKLIRIREKGCPNINMYSHHEIECIESTGYNYNSLKDVILCILDYIKINYKKDLPSIHINIEKDENIIYALNNGSKKEKSLLNVYPRLAKEWNYEKNYPLKPKQVPGSSSRKVWWKCNKGHEWETTVNNRARGSNCPYCVNQKVNKENCLATTQPQLIEEWNQARNKKVTPYDVVAGSTKKAWWICNKGHEWEASINSRVKGASCPYCTNQKVCKDNCLATTRPDIAKEWDYELNKGLTPNDVSSGSVKKVWWECKVCGHKWEAQICAICKLGTGCPECGKKQRRKGILLIDAYPDIAKEWHPALNKGINLKKITAGSHSVVWWLCSKCGHEWKQEIRARTKHNRKCRNCRVDEI